ncbi:hypothetical protein K1719_031358 [Acacia pycnantha]|nr:hypothetical protein K1719_031358 [Acacia pycnantha]
MHVYPLVQKLRVICLCIITFLPHWALRLELLNYELKELIYNVISNSLAAAKITGMLLEMEIGDLLLLLESPRSLFARVEEAVQVLNNSKTGLSAQDALHPRYFSVDVVVN